jgi:hypothetical protein
LNETTDPLGSLYQIEQPEVIAAIRESSPKDKTLVLFLSQIEPESFPKGQRYQPLMVPVEDPSMRARILVFGEYRNEIRQTLAKVVAPLIPEGYRFDFWYWVDRKIETDWGELIREG